MVEKGDGWVVEKAGSPPAYHGGHQPSWTSRGSPERVLLTRLVNGAPSGLADMSCQWSTFRTCWTEPAPVTSSAATDAELETDQTTDEEHLSKQAISFYRKSGNWELDKPSQY